MDSRTIQFQENINRRVLLDWVRIVWLPNPRKKKYDSLLEELAHDILGQDGRNTLAVYNRKNGFNINICREKTLSLQDMDRLGLYLRKRIHDEVRVKRLNGPKVTLVKGMLRVGDVVPMKPTIAAIKLNLDMSSWNGVPLLEMLTVKEKEALEVN
ncbi:unnamed protein product [Heligmosomoides polygyrus]|uniref:DNA helicase n=1 Tax=Heligmosomoides polygyrus TaxID=6339 RepID=A0A183GXA8_HELPZ|nr:unnamed protein product [Heligmosomoides polygyrus]